jgi:cellulose synthase/poly-beta-1,6-N-acetylglucosamine synthase-like glycosyltransferase
MTNVSAALEWVGLSVVVSGTLIATVNMIQLCIAVWVLANRTPPGDAHQNWVRFADVAPSISIIVPAYNEGLTICSNVAALLACEYPDYEIVVVNDGSRDDTLVQLIQRFGLSPARKFEQGHLEHKPALMNYRSALYPSLVVIDKPNGGKADALNAGINSSQGDYICVIDADSILDRDALLRAARNFIESKSDVVAVGGAIRLLNGCTIQNGLILEVAPPTNILALFQTIEYLRTFHLARTAMAQAGALTLISGAFGCFSKELMFQVGGYRHETVGEDFELSLRMQRHLRDIGAKNARIVYSPDAVCWTQAPEDLATLAKQRSRWQRGSLETLWRHRGMIGNRRYGRVAGLSMFESVLSDVVTPITEMLGYFVIPIAIVFGLLSYSYFVAFIGLSIGFGIVQSAGAIMLEELRFRRFPKFHHVLILLLGAVLENFGYRQLCSWWRIKGTFEFLLGKKAWGAMPRQALN